MITDLNEYREKKEKETIVEVAGEPDDHNRLWWQYLKTVLCEREDESAKI